MSLHNFAPAGGLGFNSGRQQRIEFLVEAALADLTSGEDYVFGFLPQGATDIVINIVPITVFNSTSSDLLDVGNTSSENAYKNDLSLQALTAALGTGLPVTSTGIYLTFRWTSGGGTPTTGLFRIFVSYVMENRSQFDHGPSIWTA
jgi:hypothetical protein